MKERRVVCAANKYEMMDGETLVVTGVRHWDRLMRAQIEALANQVWIGRKSEVQGFVDNMGVFLTREEAFEVATAANQIRHKSGNPDSKQLFSEDLY